MYNTGMKYKDSITSVISGAISMSAEARRIGVNPATLHRELVKHPDYKAAKADGRIRKPGISTDRLIDIPGNHPALEAVRQGVSINDVCRQYNVTPTALKKAMLSAGMDLPIIPTKPRRVAESELHAATVAVQRTLIAHNRALETLSSLLAHQ